MFDGFSCIVFCDFLKWIINHCFALMQACYGILKVPQGNWLCRTCALGVQPKCLLCPKRGGALKPTRSGTKWVHVSCALWIPEVGVTQRSRNNWASFYHRCLCVCPSFLVLYYHVLSIIYLKLASIKRKRKKGPSKPRTSKKIRLHFDASALVFCLNFCLVFIISSPNGSGRFWLEQPVCSAF